ncbi:hypothetical protein [Photobacterium ganghwense]|uniref:hypothetical protein n=1 Tax=Photobacterium ganghwense TaxID=320778 RepID=UPI0039F11658
MNVHKELYQLFYQASRISRAKLHGKGCWGKSALDLSQDAIRMAYVCQPSGIDICDLFEAQAAATTVMVNRNKPEFQQSQKLRDAFALWAFGGVA